MANINIVSNAKFRPFSFEERMAPLKMYKEEYDRMQDTLMQLGEEANQWQQYINADPYAAKVLEQYNAGLGDMAARLSQEGLKSINKSSLLNLRKYYNANVKPLNDAAMSLAEMQKNYKNLYAKDNTLMKGRMPTVSELIENPMATMQMVSGTDLYKHGLQSGQSASSRINNSAFGKRIAGYIENLQSQGYSPEQIAAFIADEKNLPELEAEIDNIASMYGTNTLDDPAKARRFIKQGIVDGLVHKEQKSYVQDWQSHLAKSFENQKELENLRTDNTLKEIYARQGRNPETGELRPDTPPGGYNRDGSPRRTSSSSTSGKTEKFGQNKNALRFNIQENGNSAEGKNFLAPNNEETSHGVAFNTEEELLTYLQQYMSRDEAKVWITTNVPGGLDYNRVGLVKTDSRWLRPDLYEIVVEPRKIETVNANNSTGTQTDSNVEKPEIPGTGNTGDQF